MYISIDILSYPFSYATKTLSGKTNKTADDVILCYISVTTLFEKYSDGIFSTCVINNT